MVKIGGDDEPTITNPSELVNCDVPAAVSKFAAWRRCDELEGESFAVQMGALAEAGALVSLFRRGASVSPGK